EHLKPVAPIDDRSLIDTHVTRVEVQPEQLVIRLAGANTPDRQRAKVNNTLIVPWRKTPSVRRREILLPAGLPPQHARPIRSESRALLVVSIARGRRWLDELLADATANSGPFVHLQEISASTRLRGGPGRIRTSNQTIMSGHRNSTSRLSCTPRARHAPPVSRRAPRGLRPFCAFRARLTTPRGLPAPA